MRAESAKEAASDPVSSFFAWLAAAGHVPTFERNSATLRFDILGDNDSRRRSTEHWYVTATKGDVAVSHKNGPADAVVRIGRGHLGALVTGRLTATAAYLRGLLS